MNSRIVIGDIHGCYKTLLALVAKLPKDVPITLVGDLIDRGPSSKQIVQWAIDNNIDVVKGNHEQMAIDYVVNGDNPIWLMNGGVQALRSYGAEARIVATMYRDYEEIIWKNSEDEELFKKHVEWMKSLPLILEYKDVVNSEGRYLVVTHSNVTNSWKSYKKDLDPNNRFLTQNVLWGRPQTIKDAPEIYNIHGHTPVTNEPKIKVPFANVDTGAVFSHIEGHGNLSAIQYPEMTVFTQYDID